MTPSEFRGFFPGGEFSSLADSYVQVFLTAAVPHFEVDRWGSLYSEGLANFVAHKIVIDKNRSAKSLQVDGGNVTEKHVGPVGMSFDSNLINRQATDPFLLTGYGREYARLRRIVGMGGSAV